MDKNEKWLQWAVELQSLAQAGLFYCKDKYELERYERIREISTEMLSYKTEIPLEKVKDLFCSDVGYQTPKIDTRAAIFNDGKIKEAKEESGLDVTVKRIIAVQDREKHNLPIYAYKVCKIFMQCEVTGGGFVPNIETTGFDYFGMDELPCLAEEKNNREQIEMCFRAMGAETWETLYD